MRKRHLILSFRLVCNKSICRCFPTLLLYLLLLFSTIPLAAQNCLGGRIYDDIDGDGFDNFGLEDPIPNVTVALYRDDGNNTPELGGADVLVTTVTTDISGKYCFDSPGADNYWIDVTDTNNALSAFNQGSSDTLPELVMFPDTAADMSYSFGYKAFNPGAFGIPEFFGIRKEVHSATSFYYGAEVDGIGDIDGDGVNDIAIPNFFSGNGGAIEIIFLNSDGTEKSSVAHSGNIFGFQSGTFGLAGIGDIDNDGVNDIVISGLYENAPKSKFVIVMLNQDGTVKDFTANNSPFGGTAVIYTLAGLGDINGDGVEDIAISADNGSIAITYLNEDGTMLSRFFIGNNSGGLPSGATGASNGTFGKDIAPAGDIDGDGVKDLIVGAPTYRFSGGINKGALFVLFLNPDNTVRDYSILSAGEGDLTGVPVSRSFGDMVTVINSYDDSDRGAIVVTGITAQSNQGNLYILELDSTGAVIDYETFTNGRPPSEDNFPSSVAAIGDLGGDGGQDLLVGAYNSLGGLGTSYGYYIFRSRAPDADGDGVYDYLDVDDDNDGIPDSIEGPCGDTDGDGVENTVDLDSDNDGIFDIIEANPTTLTDFDLDRDGRTDLIFSVGGNGLVDTIETSAESGTVNYTPADTDGDGVLDYIDLDSDNDGSNDVREAKYGDLDGDGTADGAVDENGVVTGLIPMTFVHLQDSDCDDIPDYLEIDANNNGIFDITELGADSLDMNNDGQADGIDGSDMDGILATVDGDTSIWGEVADPFLLSDDIGELIDASRLLLAMSFDTWDSGSEVPCFGPCVDAIRYLNYYGPGGSTALSDRPALAEQARLENGKDPTAEGIASILNKLLTATNINDPSICTPTSGTNQKGSNAARCYTGFTRFGNGNPYDSSTGSNQNGISLFVEYPSDGAAIITEGFYFESGELNGTSTVLNSTSEWQLIVYEWFGGDPGDPANVDVLFQSLTLSANPEIDWQKFYVPFPTSLNTPDWKGRKFIFQVIPWGGISGIYRFDDLAVVGFCGDVVNVGNLVWNDANRDGVADAGENGIANVEINVFRDNGDGEFSAATDIFSGTTQTDANGEWTIGSLSPNDDYFVQIAPTNFNIGAPLFGLIPTPGTSVTANADDDNKDHAFVVDAYVSEGISSSVLTLTVGAEPTTDGDDANGNLTVDFGFTTTGAEPGPNLSLGNLVWDDQNNNGVQDGGEPGIPGVIVELYRGDCLSDNNLVTSTTTDASGNYIFANIGGGDYSVVIPAVNFNLSGSLSGYTSSLDPGAAPDPNTDDNTDDNGGLRADFPGAVATEIVSLSLNGEPTDDGDTDDNTNLSVDFGFSNMANPAFANIGNLVWNDANQNGLFDGGESGIDGIDISLWLDNGDGFIDPARDTRLQQTTTAGGGIYAFSNLLDGNYYVEIESPNFQSGGGLNTFASTINGAAANADVDDDDNGQDNALPQIVGLFSDKVTLISGQEPGAAIDGDSINGNLTIDFGFFVPPATMSIGDFVWEDVNDNATFEVGEPAIQGVALTLYRDGNNDQNYQIGTDALVNTATTDVNGNYMFNNLSPGDYFVGLDASNWQAGGALEEMVSSSTFTMPNFDVNNYDKGFDNASLDSMAIGGLVSGVLTLVYNSEPDVASDGDDTNGNLTMDFGFFPPLSIGNLVWDDGMGGNGIFEAGESGLSKLTVQLVQDDGDGIYEPMEDLPLFLRTTSGTGEYQFGFLSNRDYFVVLPSTNFTNTSSEFYGFSANANVVTEASSMDSINHGLNLSDSTIVSGLISLALTTEPDVAIDGDGPNSNQTIDFGLNTPPARFRPRVFLGGAYDTQTGLAWDSLRRRQFIPTIEPHTDKQLFPIDNTGGINIDRGGEHIEDPELVFSRTGNNAPVDWIYVELRDPADSTRVVAVRSGLVQRDGDVVDVDGVSPLTFNTVPAGNYYVVIRHRNHLGAMSATPIPLFGPKVVDFTDPTAPGGINTWGEDAQVQQGDGKFALWPGNANGNNRVTFEGGSNDKDRIGSTVVNAEGNTTFSSNYIVVGYEEGDINLDGVTKFDGANNDKNVLATQVITHPDNITFAANYIILERLPE